MTFVSASQFHIYLLCLGAHLALCPNSVLNVRASASRCFQPGEGPRVVGAFSVIVKTDGSFAALFSDNAQTMTTAIRSTPAAWAGMAKRTDMEQNLFPRTNAICAGVRTGSHKGADGAMASMLLQPSKYFFAVPARTWIPSEPFMKPSQPFLWIILLDN